MAKNRNAFIKAEDADLFQLYCVTHNIPKPVREYCFAKSIGRQWRADYAWIDNKLILEVEGGIHTGGRHTRGIGFENDMEKYNTATADFGFKIIRCTPKTLLTQSTIDFIKKCLCPAIL